MESLLAQWLEKKEKKANMYVFVASIALQLGSIIDFGLSAFYFFGYHIPMVGSLVRVC